MKIAYFILPLSLGLMAAPAVAQESNAPGKGNPAGMSDQDYLIQRDKILKRMKSASPQPNQQPPAQEGGAKTEPQDSTYGQGYGSRKGAAQARPNAEHSRPERPERPHIERPGR